MYFVTYNLDWFIKNTREPRFICIRRKDTQLGVPYLFIMLSARHKEEKDVVVIYLEEVGLELPDEEKMKKLRERYEELKNLTNAVEGFVIKEVEDMFK